MFYIGIDGGGTKTKFSLINEKDCLIAEVTKGTCHFNQVGVDGLENVLREGLEELLYNAQINKKDIVRACLGLAGYGKINTIAAKIEEVVSKVFNNIDYILKNDVQIAHVGALGGEDGIVVIAGTGSIGYSLNKGINKRVGGWGYTIGDEGSAYWIGRKSIEYFSKQADGRVMKDSLYLIVKEELGIEDDYDLITYINNKLKADRGEIAKFARLCSISASKGDKGAIQIFEEAGEELGLIINTLAKDFSSNRIKASYVGGVFRSKALIIDPIKKAVNDNIEIIEPKYPPEIGACLIAKKG